MQFSWLLSLVALSALISAQASAQDAIPDQSQSKDVAGGSAGAGTTDESDFSQGGFFGIGAQKPMKKVRGINLPDQQPKMGYAQLQSPPPSASGVVEFGGQRRLSKPEVGAPTTEFPARMIYLNGRNISSVREQRLEAVNVMIDAHGNVHISAPHYEVQESTHYRPLFAKDLPKFSKPSVSEPVVPAYGTGVAPEQERAQSTPAVPPISAEETLPPQ